VANRKKRKRKQQRDTAPRAPSRSEQKNVEARAALEPLAQGERPGAVTVAAIVAAAIGLSNLAAYVAGLEVDGERPQFIGVAAFSALMLAAAWGMWRVRYWAVLGMQTLLGLLIVILSLVLFTARDIWGVLLLVAIILPAGTLFWFMVKAMARIQMPRRDQ
jgi:hypothetical protein